MDIFRCKFEHPEVFLAAIPLFLEGSFHFLIPAFFVDERSNIHSGVGFHPYPLIWAYSISSHAAWAIADTSTSAATK